MWIRIMISEIDPARRTESLGGRLVIADDSAEMRWLIRTVLGDAFLETAEAADGRELIWQLMRSRRGRGPSGKPALVVVADVIMPTYDGLQVLAAWQDGVPLVPLVVISSFPDADTRERALALGAVFLPKPFSRTQLRRATEQAIAQTSLITP
jgi:CheY-like chemotaxis protein